MYILLLEILNLAIQIITRKVFLMVIYYVYLRFRNVFFTLESNYTHTLVHSVILQLIQTVKNPMLYSKA